MEKLEIKKALRKALEIKTIIFIITVSVSLIYYARCFAKNEVLIFKKDSSVILLGIFIMTLWSLSFCIFVIFENRKLLKIIIKKDETIELLVKQLIDKTDNIQNNTNEIIEQNDYIVDMNQKQHVEQLKSNRNLSELMLLDGGDDVE